MNTVDPFPLSIEGLPIESLPVGDAKTAYRGTYSRPPAYVRLKRRDGGEVACLIALIHSVTRRRRHPIIPGSANFSGSEGTGTGGGGPSGNW